MLQRWTSTSNRSRTKSKYKKSKNYQKEHNSKYSQSYYRKIKRRRAIIFGVLATSVAVYNLSGWVVDYLDEELEEKEKIVVLGSGFASLALLDSLNAKKFDITVVSPQSSFLFTPLVAQAAIGGVKIESIAEPVRNLHADLKTNFKFYEAHCLDVDPEGNVLTCRSTGGTVFDLEYDHLIVAIGSHNDTHDTKGINNALFLNSINDARRLRNKLVASFEHAKIPGLSDEEIKKSLHFVVVGSGPIPTETVTCLHEYTREMEKSFPGLADKMQVTMISGYKDHIHNSYDNAITSYFSKYYNKKTSKLNVVDTTVSEIKKDTVLLNNGTEIPYGLLVWSTGRGANPLASKIASKFDLQDNTHSLVTDINLRVIGSENIYAIGDCATIDQGGLFDKWEKYFMKSDKDNNGYIDLNEFKTLLQHKAVKYPALLQVGLEAEKYFDMADINKDGILEIDEFRTVMKLIDKNTTRFPSTATVATQQGTYLGEIFNQYMVPGEDDNDDDEIPPFRYKHIGGYEYVGAEAGLVERGSKGTGIYTGPGARWLWHAVYASKSIPLKMRLSFIWDKAYTTVFGKGTTRY